MLLIFLVPRIPIIPIS
jgi:hypothetical protein